MKQVTTTSLTFDATEVLELIRQAYDIPEDAEIRIDADGVTVTYTKEIV